MQKQNEQNELENPVQPIGQDALEQVTGGEIESSNIVGYQPLTTHTQGGNTVIPVIIHQIPEEDRDYYLERR